jgi:hypothetical protein
VKEAARIGNWRPDRQAERAIARREFRELSSAQRAEQVFELSRFMSQVAQAGRQRRLTEDLADLKRLRAARGE